MKSADADPPQQILGTDWLKLIIYRSEDAVTDQDVENRSTKL
jgi:hypothetical protein